jgi:hypothetical protein
MEFCERFPIANSGHPVSHLRQHPLRRYQTAVEASEVLLRRLVRSVRGVEVGEKEEAVRKQTLHCFGRPWR